MGLFDSVEGDLNSVVSGGGALIPGLLTSNVPLTASGISQATQNNSSFNAPAMDAASASQVANNENSLMKTPDQVQQGLLQGTDNANSIAGQTQNQQTEQNEEGGGGMPGMTQAIGAKAAKNFQTSQGRLQQQTQLQGMQMANQNMNTAASNAIALSNAQMGVNSSINQYNLQANAARYSTISSLMGGAGSVAGAYAGQQNQQALINSMNQNNNNQPMFNGPSPTESANANNYGIDPTESIG